MAVMKSLTEAILECSDPERNLYQELSHEGEKAYAGSQSAGTIPDSKGKQGQQKRRQLLITSTVKKHQQHKLAAAQLFSLCTVQDLK